MMLGISDRSKEKHRKIILRKRKEILKGLSKELNEGIRIDPKFKSSLGSDLADLSALSSDSHLSITFANRYSSTLKQIDQALAKMDEGSYGICEECGERINKKRLEILPFTSYCIQCQRRMEEGNRRASRWN